MPTSAQLLAAIDRLLGEIARIDVNGETRAPNTLWGAVRALADAVEAGEHAEAVRLSAWQQFIETYAAGYEQFLDDLETQLDKAIRASSALGYAQLEREAETLRELIAAIPRLTHSRKF